MSWVETLNFSSHDRSLCKQKTVEVAANCSCLGTLFFKRNPAPLRMEKKQAGKINGIGQLPTSTGFFPDFFQSTVPLFNGLRGDLASNSRSPEMSWGVVHQCYLHRPSKKVGSWAVFKGPWLVVWYRGWKTTQLYGDFFISQYNDPVINQSV